MWLFRQTLAFLKQLISTDEHEHFGRDKFQPEQDPSTKLKVLIQVRQINEQWEVQ